MRWRIETQSLDQTIGNQAWETIGAIDDHCVRLLMAAGE